MSVYVNGAAATLEESHAPEPSLSPAQEPLAPQTPSPPQTDLNQLAAAEAARGQLIEELVSQGVDRSRARRVAEASVRRAESRRSGQAFYFADMESEFDVLCRNTGGDPASIASAKQRVWTIARETAELRGCALEEALFFCFHESLYLHRELLANASVTNGAAVGVPTS
jgi:hypothetical protein